MNLHDYMRKCGVPVGQGYEYYAQRWLNHGMTVRQALTQQCIDCFFEVVHPNAMWRLQEHVIRCSKCQKKAIRQGATEFEAKYVV